MREGEREREIALTLSMSEKVRERERPMYSELSPFNSYQIDMKVIYEENKINDITPPAFINKYFCPDSCSFLAVMCSRYNRAYSYRCRQVYSVGETAGMILDSKPWLERGDKSYCVHTSTIKFVTCLLLCVINNMSPLCFPEISQI